MKKILTIFSICMLFSLHTQAQVTFSTSSPNVEVGAEICVDINVNNFTDILSFQLNINWDTNVLAFASVNQIASGLPNLNGTFGMSQTNVGNLINGWTAPNNEAFSFGPGTIYQVCFTAVGVVGDTSPITFTNNAPSSMNVYQIVNGNEENVFDSSVFTAGLVTIVNSTQPLPFETSISNESVFEGANICVDIDVANFTDMTGFDYTLSWNPAELTYTGFNIGTLGLANFSTSSFNAVNAATGDLTVSWDTPGGGITIVNGTLYQVCFDAVGSAGTMADVSFTSDILPVNVQNTGGSVPLNGTDGVVSILSTGSGDPSFVLEDVNVCSDDASVCVAMSVLNFDNIGSAQFPIVFDPSILSFDTIIIPGNSLPNLTVGDSFNSTLYNGQINFNWTTNLGQGSTVDDGEEIFYICFDILNSNSASTIYMGPPAQGNLPVEGTTLINFMVAEVPLDITNSGSVLVGPQYCINNEITVDSMDVTCNGAMDGSITLTTSEVSTYMWAPPLSGNTTNMATNLSGGTYTVTVTSAGVPQVLNIVVNEPNPINYSISSTVDNTCVDDMSGEIHIIPSGGTSPYVITWSNGGGMGPDITGLANGSYTPTIMDANDCVFEGSAITIGSLSNLDVALNVITQPTNNDGVVQAVVTGANGSVTYAWSAPYTDIDDQVDNAGVGLISVTVTDALGCTAMATMNLMGMSSDIIIDSIQLVNSLDCFGDCDGIIKVYPSGGNNDYTFTWNPAISNTDTASDLCAGDYQVTVSDSFGNTVATETYTLTQPNDLVIGFDMTPTTGSGNADGSVNAIVSGGTSDYNYTWSDDNATMTALLSNVLAGFYTVNVVDAKGCTASNVTEVTDGLNPDCFGYNKVVTANQDSKNDFFVMSCVEFTKVNTLEIYNRWGQKVYDATNYSNTWDGHDNNGEALVEGGYYFVFAYTDFDDKSFVIKGSINLLRK